MTAEAVWIIWIVLSIAILLGWEIFAIATKRKGQTLSEAVWRWIRVYPYLGLFVGLILGLLLGHFFWYAK